MSTATNAASIAPPSMLYPWLRAFASLALSTLGGAGLYAGIVSLKHVAADFDVSRSDVSLAYAATMLGFGVGGILMGWLSDRVGVMWPAILGAGCLTIGLVVAGTATELWQYILAHGLLIGLIGNASVMVSLVADITRWFSVNRGIAVAIVISGNYVAGALWPPIIQHGLDTVGWRDTYLWLAGLCLIGMTLCALVLWKRADIASETLAADTDRARPLGFSPWMAQALICLAGTGCCVAMAMPQAHIVAHASDLKLSAGAQMLSLMLGFGVVSRLFFGWLSDRIGGLRTVLAGSSLQAIALASFIPLTTLDPLLLASALFGLAQGGIVPAYTMVIRAHFPASETGWRVGLLMLFTLIGMAFGGWIAGLIFDITGSYTFAFINAIAFNIANLIIVFTLLAKTGFARAA